MMAHKALSQLNLASHDNPGIVVGRGSLTPRGDLLSARSPIDGATLATVRTASTDDVASVIDRAFNAFHQWRLVPAPRRGEFVRLTGEKLRQRKRDLATLVA